MSKKPISLGFIPARANSKGIKQKNIIPLDGKPLISYTIESALESELDHIFVSTDSEDIAQIARNHSIDVPFLRPKSLSGDTDTIEDAIIALLNEYNFEIKFQNEENNIPLEDLYCFNHRFLEHIYVVYKDDKVILEWFNGS